MFFQNLIGITDSKLSDCVSIALLALLPLAVAQNLSIPFWFSTYGFYGLDSLAFRHRSALGSATKPFPSECVQFHSAFIFKSRTP